MKKIDLAGTKFGRLLATEPIQNKFKRLSWLCMCDCGNQKIIASQSLIRGLTKSCGCIRKEIIIKRNKLLGSFKWDGYNWEPDENDPYGYIKKSRRLMQERIGRPLTPNEIVHHINGVKDDDRIENLILTTKEEHGCIHHPKGIPPKRRIKEGWC